jgi:hypothetical protein
VGVGPVVEEIMLVVMAVVVVVDGGLAFIPNIPLEQELQDKEIVVEMVAQ